MTVLSNTRVLPCGHGRVGGSPGTCKVVREDVSGSGSGSGSGYGSGYGYGSGDGYGDGSL